MSKRDRHLKQRLDELFSSPPTPPDIQPETPESGREALPPWTAAPADLSYLEAVIAQLPLPAYLKDHEHTWVAVNAAFAQIVGHTPEALLGHSDKEQADEAWQMDDRVLDNGRGEDWEETAPLPDGSIRRRRTRRTPLFGERREVRYVMGVVQETITPAPGMHAHVLASNETFHAAIDAMPHPVIISRVSDDVILYANQPFSTITGVPLAQLVGQRATQFYADVQYRERVTQAVRQHDELHGFEARVRRAEGSASWVSLSTRRLKFNDEACVITTLEDISARKQAEEDLMARNSQLATYNRVGQELAQLVTSQEVMEHIFKTVGEILDNRNLYIALRDERKREITYPICTIDDERQPAGARPFDNGLTEYVLRTRQALLIPRDAQKYAASTGSADIGRPARCYLGVPMLSGDQALGVIAVQDHDHEDAYSAADAELLSAIAAQAAAALENVRLYAAEARRAVQLQTAAEISTAASTVLNVDELLPFVVNLIQQRFSLYYVGLFLVDAVHQNAILRAGTGEAGQLMLNRRHQLPLDDRSMIGWCIQHQTPRVALDVGEDAVHFNNPALPDTRSELALPLISRGQVLGAMTVQSIDAAAFSEQDIAILQTMSDQVATTIANAQLFEQASLARRQSEARLRETQFLQRVGQAVSSTLDLSSVLDVVMETLQRELGFTHNALALVDRQAETVSVPRASGTAAGLQGLTRPIEQLQNDIIMDILRKGRIEVIDGWDDRFNREIYESQGHAVLVRAFVPLRLRGESIGLLEVGYRRAERAHITPDEVRLLGGLADQIAIAVGNARLFDETQRRVTELQTLNDISQLIVSQHELTTLLQQVGEIVLRTFKVDTGFVAVYDDHTQTVDFPFYMDEGRLTHVPRQPLGKGLTSHVIEHRQPLLIRRLTPELSMEYNGIMVGTGELQQSWLGVPIMVGDTVQGVLNVQAFPANQFDEDAVRLLRTIAGTAGIAIQSARLFEETRTRAEERTALYDLSQVLASRLTVDQVLQEVYHGVSRLLDTSNFYIGLYSPEKNRVSFLLNITESQQDKEIQEVSADQGLTGYIIRTKSPLLIREGLLRWEEEHGIRPVGELAASWLGVPLLVGQQVLGVMAIQSYTESRLYDEHDRNLLMSIASQAVIALQNARLFEQTQQNTRELAALNEFGQAVSQQLEIEQVLEVAFQRLQQLLPVDAFFAALYDRAANTISFPVIYDEGKRYSELPFPFNPDSSTGQVILTGEPVLELLTPDELAALTEVEGALGNVDRPSASLLYVPLRVGPQTIGTLSVQSYQVNAYDQDTVQLASNVANQVAIAIQNARLFNEARQRSTELTALNQIISSATQTLDLHALLDTVLKQTLDLFGFDGGLITMFNADRQKLERTVRAGLPGQIPADPAEGLENSLCTYVFDSKQTLVIEDFREGAPIDVSGEIEAGYYSYIGIPLEARGRMLGTWCGYRRVAGPFDKSTLPLLQAVGYQLGFAIENVRLFEQTQRAARHEQTLREITSRVRSSTDPDAIARTAVRELGLALGRKTFIRLGDAEQLGRTPQADQEVPVSGEDHNTGLEGGQ